MKIPLRACRKTKCLFTVFPLALLFIFLIQLSSDNTQPESRVGLRVSLDKVIAERRRRDYDTTTQHGPTKQQDSKLHTNPGDKFRISHDSVALADNAKLRSYSPSLFDKQEDKQQPILAHPAATSTQTREKTRVRLIILAYMRTGSTMLGDIFQINPDVFYWFEPLHKLGAYMPRKDYIEHHNLGGPQIMNQTWLDAIPVTQVQTEEFMRSDAAKGNLSAILSCDLQHVWPGALGDRFAMGRGRDTKSLSVCFSHAGDQTAFSKCLQDARDQCLGNRTVVALKTIRFRMVRALELLLEDPKVRVLHLVRDPRAVLLSRYRTGYANLKQLPLEASRQCRPMADDLDLANTVLNPDVRRRYRLVRYEDIAANPVEAAKHLYKFVQLEPSENDLRRILNMSKSARSRRRCWGCKSEMLTSQQVSQNWRLMTSRHYAGLVSGPCSDVLLNLGYRLVFDSDNEVRNLSVPALGKPRYKTVWSPWLNS